MPESGQDSSPRRRTFGVGSEAVGKPDRGLGKSFGDPGRCGAQGKEDVRPDCGEGSHGKRAQECPASHEAIIRLPGASARETIAYLRTISNLCRWNRSGGGLAASVVEGRIENPPDRTGLPLQEVRRTAIAEFAELIIRAVRVIVGEGPRPEKFMKNVQNERGGRGAGAVHEGCGTRNCKRRRRTAIACHTSPQSPAEYARLPTRGRRNARIKLLRLSGM